MLRLVVRHRAPRSGGLPPALLAFLVGWSALTLWLVARASLGHLGTMLTALNGFAIGFSAGRRLGPERGAEFAFRAAVAAGAADRALRALPLLRYLPAGDGALWVAGNALAGAALGVLAAIAANALLVPWTLGILWRYRADRDGSASRPPA